MPELDPDQEAAVSTGPSDVFIAAGAGSGKTRVLTARFVSAVLGEAPYPACDPREILAVTFTEKAAGELAERIRRALVAAGDDAAARALGEAWISTIHGMCARILRQHAFAAGIDPYFGVLDQVEASALEARALGEAIEERLAADEGATALLDAHGFEQIATAVLRVSASIRSLGLGAESIHTVARDEAVAQLTTAMAELEEIAEEMGRLRPCKTVDGDIAAVRTAARLIEDGLAAGGPDAQALAHLASPGLRRLASAEGLNDLVDAAAASIERARQGVAQLLVAGHEASLLALVASFEQRYARFKRARGVLDFTDLETETLRLLEADPSIAARYRSRFAMLMLDEFQDTNVLQARIIALLSSGNLCTVGDENQSIYRFRHADVGVFRERARTVNDRRRLDVNYRTAPALLGAVNTLFGHPALLGPAYAPLRAPSSPTDEGGEFARHPRFQARFIDWSEPQGADAQEVEAAAIADSVCEYLGAGIEPGEVAILMRALSGGRGQTVERALAARGVPVYLASGGAFFDCQEIIEVRALLHVIDNVLDDAAMAIVLAGRLVRLSADSLVALREHADALAVARDESKHDVHLWDALTSTDLHLPDGDAGAAARLVATVTDARDRRGMRPLGETVTQPLLALDADLVLFASGPGGTRAWSNVLKLARMATEYEAAYGGDLAGLLAYLKMRELHATSEQEATLDGEYDAVRVMSIHAAKGLEFPVVIVAGLTKEPGIPSIALERIDGQPLLGMALPSAGGSVHTIGSERVKVGAREAAEAESVRLLYVACTRAEEALTVIGRTKPDKDADDSLTGRLRQALGGGSPGSFQSLLAHPAPDVAVRLLVPQQRAGDTTTCSVGPQGAVLEPACEGERAVTSGAADSALGRPEPVVPPRVSYTGLATYERCPYRFFLTSILKLPAPPAAQGGDALVFGSAAHAVLERARSLDDDLGPSIEMAARAAGLDRRLHERLTQAVSGYLASDIARELLSADRIMREAPIAVPVAGTVLAGAIDAIGWTGDEALIVDYKSGTGPLTPEEAVVRYRLQGECYSLAAFAAGATAVRIVFFELERPWSTSYEYGRADRERIELSVSAIIRRMAQEGYPSRAAYEREQCETCPGLGGMCAVIRPMGDAAG